MGVSVVIRCIGREKLFCGVLDHILCQTIAPSEILVVMDSINERETAYVNKHLEAYPNCKLQTFRHEEFSHPYSVNLGVDSSKEDFVCITNGHSLPSSPHWLGSGLRHFEDEKVAAVGGFFFPSNRGFSKNLFFLVEGPAKRISWVSTINCIIRKSRWEEYPFDENLLNIIPETKKYGGEDYDWTLEMISRGFKVVLDQDFSVVHAHEKDIVLEICRNLRNYFIYRKLQEKIKKLRRPRKALKFSRKEYADKELPS
ncbi:MAG: glycosyltransferase family 2 protein [Candidatus Bathyarchaeota archaeon]|nr:MAG: glycosyltransferase family 2 protein [Candidatus Bathyarchaeota archaeon]